jgi:glycogen synthase
MHPRVALFPSAFHPSLGGVEELTRRLALEQSRRGAAPIVVTMRWPRDVSRTSVVDGIDVHREVFRTPEGSLRRTATYAATTWATRRRIAALLRAHGTQVVHVQCVSGNAHYAMVVASGFRWW